MGDDEFDVEAFEAFVRKANEINARYDNERRVTDSWRSWTPKQRHRVRKQKAKWRRRMLGEF